MNRPTDNLPLISRSDNKSDNKHIEKVPVKSRKSRKWPVIAIIVGAFVFSFLGNYLADQLTSSDDSRQATQSGQDGNRILSQDEQDIATVAESVSPSVVSISTASSSTNRFGIVREGAGTGVVVSADGYVLTNKHVVEGASSVEVTFKNGRQFDRVRVVAVDPLNDIAFLKINGVSDLPVAELGNSSTIQIGQQVVAIGNSLGQFQNTVTSGIISGTNRPISAQAGDSIETLTDLIQTDAAINPGNSGGPLVNMSGQVIGINTAIAADAEGIGFAIPVNSTKGMLKSLLEDGKASRSYLGVSYLPLNAENSAEYDLSADHGAYVFAERGNPVADNGPADKAGIREGDVITHVDGIKVGPGGGVATLIGAFAPGDKVEITLLRGDDSRTVEVTLGSYPE